MTDNNQDRSQDEGQQGIDRETERRNRENETGQQGGQSPSGQDRGGVSETDQSSGSDFGGAASQGGQSSFGGDTRLQDRQGQTGGQSATGEGSSGAGGFVGSDQDNSSDYLTKGEQDQDFAPEGQGAEDSSAGQSDIETGQSQDRDSGLDDGSDTSR